MYYEIVMEETHRFRLEEDPQDPRAAALDHLDRQRQLRSAQSPPGSLSSFTVHGRAAALEQHLRRQRQLLIHSVAARSTLRRSQSQIQHASIPAGIPYYLFVYGSLRPDQEDGPLLETNVKYLWASATAQGHTLYASSGGSYPFAVHTGKRTDVIVGTVLYSTDPDQMNQLLRDCDQKEGYRRPSKHRPARTGACYYQRDLIPVTLGDGRKVNAYIYHKPPAAISSSDSLVVSGDWVQHCRVCS